MVDNYYLYAESALAQTATYPAFVGGGLGPPSGDFTQDLWWPNWHPNGFPPSAQALPPNHVTNCCISVIYLRLRARLSRDARIHSTTYDLQGQVLYSVLLAYLLLLLIQADQFISATSHPSTTPPYASILVSALYIYCSIHSALEKSPFKGPLLP